MCKRALEQVIQGGAWDLNLALDVPYSVEPAQTVNALEIYGQTSGKVKNAGYDAHRRHHSRAGGRGLRRGPGSVHDGRRQHGIFLLLDGIDLHIIGK